MIMPLSEPIRGRDGSTINEVIIPKHTLVLAHYQASNTYRALWGEDANEWKPERWLAPLPAALEDARVPGVYSNLCVALVQPRKKDKFHTDVLCSMSFSGGARSCM